MLLYMYVTKDFQHIFVYNIDVYDKLHNLYIYVLIVLSGEHDSSNLLF